jgi:uncharacterized protein (TIGR02246 family)
MAISLVVAHDLYDGPNGQLFLIIRENIFRGRVRPYRTHPRVGTSSHARELLLASQNLDCLFAAVARRKLVASCSEDDILAPFTLTSREQTMRTFLTCLAVLSLFSTAALAADDAGIKDRMDEFQAAWNKDDTTAMAALFAEDGTLITPVGILATGRAEIAKVTGDEHTAMFKNTKYEISDIKTQEVTPDVTVADVTAKVVGMKGRDGAVGPDFVHHVTWVFVKKDGKWMASAVRPYQFLQKPRETK